MGSGRAQARSNRARPPASDPVNATAAIAGCLTSSTPVARPETTAKVPVGAPAWSSAAPRTAATDWDRPGWDGCALTTTGQPAARAEAVSPPGTLKAKGKLLAAKTATGPIGTTVRRRSGRGPIGLSTGGLIVVSRWRPAATAS